MENIITEVSNLIKESECVSKEVAILQKQVLRKINDFIKTFLVTDSYGKYGINTYLSEFTDVILDNKVNVKCVVIQGKNYECLKNYLNNIKNIDNSFNINKETLEISMVFVVYYIQDKFIYVGNKDALYHEIEHLYQYSLRKKNDKSYNPFKNEFLYNKTVELMYSKDFLEKCIGIIIYLSDYNEQDAIVQGLQGEINYNDKVDGYKKYEISNTRKMVNNLSIAINTLEKKYKKDYFKIDEICKNCGMTFQKLIKTGKIANERLKSKVAKALNYLVNNSKNVLTKSLFEEIVEDNNN